MLRLSCAVASDVVEGKGREGRVGVIAPVSFLLTRRSQSRPHQPTSFIQYTKPPVTLASSYDSSPNVIATTAIGTTFIGTIVIGIAVIAIQLLST